MKKLLTIMSAVIIICAVVCVPVYAKDIKADDYYTIDIPGEYEQVKDATDASDKDGALTVCQLWQKKITEDYYEKFAVMVQVSKEKHNFKTATDTQLDDLASQIMKGFIVGGVKADYETSKQDIGGRTCMKVAIRNIRNGEDDLGQCDIYVFYHSKKLYVLQATAMKENTLEADEVTGIVNSFKVKTDFVADNMVYIIIGVSIIAIIVVINILKHTGENRKVNIQSFDMSNNFEGYNKPSEAPLYNENHYYSTNQYGSQQSTDQPSYNSQVSSPTYSSPAGNAVSADDFFSKDFKMPVSGQSTDAQPQQNGNSEAAPDDYSQYAQSNNQSDTEDTDMGSLSVPDTDIDFGEKKEEDTSGWLNS